MTEQEKIKVKEEILSFYKKTFSGYPENQEVKDNPDKLIHCLPQLYENLVNKKVIEKEKIPYQYFEHIAINKFREAHVESMLNSFF